MTTRLLLALLTLLLAYGSAYAQQQLRSTPSGEPTFSQTGTQTTSGTKRKRMGFGDLLRRRLAAKKAREQAANSPTNGAPAAPPASTGSEPSAPPTAAMTTASALDLGYAAIEEGEYATAFGYLRQAEEQVDLSDGDAALELFELYALLASESAAMDNEDMAFTYLNRGEDVLNRYFDSAPNMYEEVYVMEEAADLYYQLGLFGTAGDLYAQIADFTFEPLPAYMAASCFALEGESQEALDYLEFALAIDFLEEECIDIAYDSDLDSIRDTEYFAYLQEEYGF
jgi:tetratricopeptide (TPR) repeat protein